MITKEMTISEILERDERYEKIFDKYFLTCAGCPGAQSETIEQAAEGHGLNLEDLLKDLNRAEQE